MVTEPQTIVSRNLARLLDPQVLKSTGIDLEADLSARYGLTSLSMVLLITSICEEAEIDLIRITEDEFQRLRTPRDIIALVESMDGRGV
jgi:acyl carrier protein